MSGTREGRKAVVGLRALTAFFIWRSQMKEITRTTGIDPIVYSHVFREALTRSEYVIIRSIGDNGGGIYDLVDLINENSSDAINVSASIMSLKIKGFCDLAIRTECNNSGTTVIPQVILTSTGISYYKYDLGCQL